MDTTKPKRLIMTLSVIYLFLLKCKTEYVQYETELEIGQ
jgi:hypothetical protein